MLSHTKRLGVLFTSVIILLAGHGLQLTSLPLRAELLGWSINDIGMTGSFYFLGFLLGCIFIPRFIAAVGHIRTFSTLTKLEFRFRDIYHASPAAVGGALADDCSCTGRRGVSTACWTDL